MRYKPPSKKLAREFDRAYRATLAKFGIVADGQGEFSFM